MVVQFLSEASGWIAKVVWLSVALESFNSTNGTKVTSVIATLGPWLSPSDSASFEHRDCQCRWGKVLCSRLFSDGATEARVGGHV